MKLIELTQGKFSQVDDADFEWLSQWNWHTKVNVWGDYAARAGSRVHDPKSPKAILMHRAITGAPRAMQVDHIDHNGLNNQRSNLRLCTPSQNSQNVRPAKRFTSKYKGVSFCKTTCRWRAYIHIDGKFKHIGHFVLEEVAAHAYDKVASEHFGEFAYLNFPPNKP